MELPDPPPSATAGDAAGDAMLWDDAMAIGNATIDKQHRALFELAPQLLRHQPDGLDAVALLTDYKQFRRLTYANFDFEELVMERLGVPEAVRAAHRDEHQRIREQMDRVLKDSRTFYDMIQLVRFLLQRWLPRHLHQHDRPLAMQFARAAEVR